MKNEPVTMLLAYSVFFFPVKNQIVPVKKNEKVAREKKSAREKTWKTLKKCTWKNKIARENFSKNVPVKLKLMHVKKIENYARETSKVPVKKYIDYIFSVFCKSMFFSRFFR